jgi:hypothetical protein
MRKKDMRLPARLPLGSKYVLETRGRMHGSILVQRYVELPDGRRIELAARMVSTCCAGEMRRSNKFAHEKAPRVLVRA